MTPKQISQYLSSAYGVATQPIIINGTWTAQYRSLKELGRSVKDDKELGEWQEQYNGGYYVQEKNT